VTDGDPHETDSEGRETDETEAETATGPLDEPTLRLLGARAVETRLVVGQTFEPDAITPRRLRLTLDTAQYPATVTQVTLDVRWFESGDYSFHYRESRDAADDWQCRWDRHPKPSSPRAHFHPPPAAGTAESSPVDDTHLLSVLFAVLDWIADRVGDAHGC
jgi:hypothetical protein